MTSRRPFGNILLKRWLVRSLATATVAVVLGGGQGEAQAQPATDKSIDVQLFQAGIGHRPYFTLDGAQVPRHKQFALGLSSNYMQRPFVISSLSQDTGTETTFAPVEHMMTSELIAAIGIQDKFQLGFALPYSPYMKGDDFNAQGEPTGGKISGGGLGDLRIEGKAKVAEFGDHNEFAFAVSPGISVPIGNKEKFLGDKSLTGRLRGVLEMRLEDFRLAAGMGFVFRQSSQNFKAEVGHQLTYAVAGEYFARRDVSLLAEVFGRSGLNDFFKRYADANPAELDLGLRVALPGQFSVTLGGGFGLVKGIGAPGFRGFLGFAWAPDFSDKDGDGIFDVEDRCPDEPEDSDGWKDSDGCPEVDNDGDALLDGQDKCPNEAEDFDQFQDDDGCPEADNDKDGIDDIKDPCPNAAEDGKGKRPKDGCPSSSEDGDGDGVPDARDKCPDEPEDRDGFQDYDGCPEVDNDNDSIPDQFDGCPNEAEDADGVEDADGCPDPDNDKDGLLDAVDKCPAEAETLNGNKDEDGCPDAGAEIVKLVGDKIELRERIGFSGINLSPTGQVVANLVAMVMRGNPDISKLRIEVSADNATKTDTQSRADAIARFLETKGVVAARIKAVGMGAGATKVELIVESRESAQKKAPAGKEKE